MWYAWNNTAWRWAYLTALVLIYPSPSMHPFCGERRNGGGGGMWRFCSRRSSRHGRSRTGSQPSPAGGAAGPSAPVPVCRGEPNGARIFPSSLWGAASGPFCSPSLGWGVRWHLLPSRTSFKKGKASWSFLPRKAVWYNGCLNDSHGQCSRMCCICFLERSVVTGVIYQDFYCHHL